MKTSQEIHSIPIALVLGRIVRCCMLSQQVGVSQEVLAGENVVKGDPVRIKDHIDECSNGGTATSAALTMQMEPGVAITLCIDKAHKFVHLTIRWRTVIRLVKAKVADMWNMFPQLALTMNRSVPDDPVTGKWSKLGRRLVTDHHLSIAGPRVDGFAQDSQLGLFVSVELVQRHPDPLPIVQSLVPADRLVVQETVGFQSSIQDDHLVNGTATNQIAEEADQVATALVQTVLTAHRTLQISKAF